MKKSHANFASWLLIWSATAVPIQAQLGFADLGRLDRLAEFKTSVRIGSVSSYDRTGGNDDGFSGKYSFVRKEEGGVVLADLKGPGIIHRIWTPTPTDDLLEFFFDGNEKPAITIKYRDLFLGKDPRFPAPLTGFGVGGYFCYAPLPYAKSCIVRLKAEKTQFYQINYSEYPEDAAIVSFPSISSEKWGELIEMASKPLRFSGGDIADITTPPGAETTTTRTAVSVGPGKTVTLFESTTPGRIIAIRLSPLDILASKKRDVLLKITFDDGVPAVICPVGDFFGCVWGRAATQSLLIGNLGTTGYSYFPMPFDLTAKIELVSERSEPLAVQAEAVHCAVARRTNEGRFYALWRRENPTTEGQPYTFLETEGRGHLVGVVLQAQGLESGKTLFFEGDDQATIDGELTIHGTGSEDFFNGGWYDVPDRWEKRLCFPLSGCLGYEKPVGRTAAYRLFLGDACAFRRSLRLTIEHSGEKNNIPTDYASVAYFYSDRASSAVPGIAPLNEREVADPVEAIFPAWWQTPVHAWSFDHATLSRKKVKLGDEEIRYLSLVCEGKDWFGSHFYSPSLNLPAAGVYAVFLDGLKGPAQAQIQLFENENPVGPMVDLYAEAQAKSGRLWLGDLPLQEGRNNLMIKLIGKNGKSEALGLDVIHLICVLQKEKK